jgi:hypothetical protein
MKHDVTFGRMLEIKSILGFPAMTQLIMHFNLKPHYTTSIAQVYQNATLMAIKQSRKLELLYYVDHPLPKDNSGVISEADLLLKDGFPSWVARWDIDTLHKSFPLADYITYNDKTEICVSLLEEPEGDAIKLKGLYIDRVAKYAAFLHWHEID